MAGPVGKKEFDFEGEMLSVKNAKKATPQNTVIYDAAKKAFFVADGTYTEFVGKKMKIKVTKEDGTTEILKGKVSVRSKEQKKDLKTKIESLKTEAMKLHKEAKAREREITLTPGRVRRLEREEEGTELRVVPRTPRRRDFRIPLLEEGEEEPEMEETELIDSRTHRRTDSVRSTHLSSLEDEDPFA